MFSVENEYNIRRVCYVYVRGYFKVNSRIEEHKFIESLHENCEFMFDFLI